MYWFAFPLFLLLFGGLTSEDLYGFRRGTDTTVEVAQPASGDWGTFRTSEGVVGIPPNK
jgi:hypothetical protein